MSEEPTQQGAQVTRTRKLLLSGLGLAIVLSLYLLYQTTRAHVPEGLEPSTPARVVPKEEVAERARTWLESESPEARGPEHVEYAEGEVEPEMQGVSLTPRGMSQAVDEEIEPEVLPEPLSAVLAAVNAPFRRTFEAFDSFAVKMTFTFVTSEPELGDARTVGSVTFTKDADENWHAAYNVDTDSRTTSYNEPLYKSQFWLIGNAPYVQRPGKSPVIIGAESPTEDQELLNQITGGQLELLSHEVLRRFVREAKRGLGYDEPSIDRWEGRPVDVYQVAPPHYGEDVPDISVSSRSGSIWIDRELGLPLKADLAYTAKMTIPSPRHYTYDTSQRVTLEVLEIGTAPQVGAPEVK